MKHVHVLSDATPLLKDFVAEFPDERSWTAFRNWRGGDALKELIGKLLDLQHGLCCYCEIDLIENDRQIEHFLPKGNTGGSQNRTTDYTNLMGCCCGGTLRNFFGEDNPRQENRDPDRHVEPTKENSSCGQIKENHEPQTTGKRILDPRRLPADYPIVKTDHKGEIKPIPEACESAGISVADVESTINFLGLNCPRLKTARKKRLKNLEETYDRTNMDILFYGAKAELLPGENGQLPSFFTTSRTFFGFAAEQVLTRPHTPDL